VAIDEHVGERVRVGGLVDALETDGFRLDDGTAVGRVVLEAAALPQLASLAAGDALSVVGRVEGRSSEAASETVIVVDDPAAIARAGDPVPDASSGLDPIGLIVPGDSPGPDPGIQTAALADPVVPEVGAVGIVLIGIASLAITWLRRQRGRRRLAARIANRLEAIAVPRQPATVAVEASQPAVERARPSS
jgi:hypothetical protein